MVQIWKQLPKELWIYDGTEEKKMKPGVETTTANVRINDFSISPLLKQARQKCDGDVIFISQAAAVVNIW